MRYWQPNHHLRWQAFLAGLDSALGGEHYAKSELVPELEPVLETPVPILDELPPVTEIPPVQEILAEPLIDIAVETPAEIVPQPMLESEVQALVEPITVSPSTIAPAETVDTAVALPPQDAFTPQLSNASLALGSARSFFSGLGWSGGGSHFAAKVSVDHTRSYSSENTVKKPAELGQRNQAAFFFRNIPWSGSSQYGEVISSFRVTANHNDLGLDPRTADLPNNNPLITGMLSAARTSDRLAARSSHTSKARSFFSSLPWTHS
jgi:hypothetical protein